VCRRPSVRPSCDYRVVVASRLQAAVFLCYRRTFLAFEQVQFTAPHHDYTRPRAVGKLSVCHAERYINFSNNKSIGDDTKAAARQSLNCIKNKTIKYSEKQFSIWRMEFLHPAMWHVALESWQWIHQVAAPCNVIRGSEMTCNWIRPNIHHIGILHLVLISTTSPQSTCHSAPVSDILSKSDHPRQKNMTPCRFSRWRISAIFDFRDPIMGSLKSACATSYRSSKDSTALNCLLFEKIAFFLHFGDMSYHLSSRNLPWTKMNSLTTAQFPTSRLYQK